MAQGSEVLNARLEAFKRYETTLIGQVRDHVALARPTCYISCFEEGSRDGPLLLSVQTLEGKEEGNLLLWIR